MLDLIRKHDPSTVLVACTAGFFVTFFVRMAISPVVPFISEDFGVSNGTIGLALTGMWLAYGLAQYPSGILGERFGEKQVVLLAVGGSTVTGVLLAIAPIFATFVVIVVVFGATAGLHYSPATTLLARTHDNVGRAIGVHLLGAPVAGLIAPVIAAWIGVRYGWRPAIALVVFVGIPTFALVAWGVPRTPPQHPDEGLAARFQEGAGLRVVTRPAILLTLLVAMCGTFTIQGLLSFLPTFLVDHRTFSPTVAGVAFSAFFVLRAISQFGLGTLSDRYGRDPAIIVAMLTGSVGIFGMVIAPGDLTVAIAIAMTGVGMGFFAVTDPRFLDALGDEEQGSGFGTVRTAYTVVGSAGSVVVGGVSDLFGWPAAFFVLGVIFGLAGLAMVVNHVFELGY